MCNQDTIETKPIEMVVTASEDNIPIMPIIAVETYNDQSKKNGQ